MVNNGIELTKALLESYKIAQSELEGIERQIDRYSHLQIKSEYGVVKGSMTDYPYAERHIVLSGSDVKSDKELQDKLCQAMISLHESENRYISLMLDVDMAIQNIEDPLMRVILHEKYFNKLTDKQIAERLGYERSTITHKLATFFEKESQKSH